MPRRQRTIVTSYNGDGDVHPPLQQDGGDLLPEVRLAQAQGERPRAGGDVVRRPVRIKSDPIENKLRLAADPPSCADRCVSKYLEAQETVGVVLQRANEAQLAQQKSLADMQNAMGGR
ncbi:hypothetical protein ACHAWF_005960 [Thalassiosira exigua]